MRRVVFTGALVVLAAAALAAATSKSYSAASGEGTFKRYCSNCHGVGGRGDGAIAGTLGTPPADLTQIAVRNGGTYPGEQVWAKIDGRAEIVSHGPREMPVWGDALLWPEEDSPARREEVNRKIGELVAYVGTLQKPAATTEVK